MHSQDWDIRPRGTVCQKCQGPFTDQQAYVSRLNFGEKGYERADYCEACWAQQEEAGQAVSVWKGVYKPPPPAPEEPIKKETAESLLRRMIEHNEASRKNVIFILAVMLERRRILVEKDVQVRDDGSTIRVYEHRHTGETFVITDPMLLLDQLQQVQEEVMAILSNHGSGIRSDSSERQGTGDGGQESGVRGQRTNNGQRTAGNGQSCWTGK